MPKNKKTTEEKYQEVIDALKKDYKEDSFDTYIKSMMPRTKLDYKKFEKFEKLFKTIKPKYEPWINPQILPTKNTYKIFKQHTTRRINA